MVRHDRIRGKAGGIPRPHTTLGLPNLVSQERIKSSPISQRIYQHHNDICNQRDRHRQRESPMGRTDRTRCLHHKTRSKDMRPQCNDIVELHDAKQQERGFGCMKLIALLTRDGVTAWEQWHGAHIQAAAGQCPYTGECPIHAKETNTNYQPGSTNS